MANQFGPALRNCPRCQAPLQPGQQKCHICALALNPASLQQFYNYQQQTMGATTPQMQAQQRLSSAAQRIIAIAVIGIIAALCVCFGAVFLVFANIH